VAAIVADDVVIKAKGNVQIDATGLGNALSLSGANLQVIGIKVIGGTDGITLVGNGGLLLKCRVSDVTGRGIVLTGLGPTAEKCKVERSGGDGIALTTAFNTTVEKCQVIDGQASGISVAADCTEAFVFKCRVLRPAVDGVVNAGGGTFVEGTRIIDAVGRGIVDEAAPGASPTDFDFNKIIRPGGDGIVCSGPPASVTDNRIVKPGGTGVDISVSTAFVVVNKVATAGGDGLHIAGNEGEWIANRSSGATGNGFVLDGINNTLQLNKGKGSGGFDLLDNQPGNNTITDDNHFGTVGP
jgi:hypothetical protein